ncbi:ferritin heavy polypeptide-like 17 [Rattus rattus]|uniref:ferritin heavy polypeptide-like 17 n=1 Tax=Rattus rattus TaxID=10117 RepID=UPI0013F2C426|nr:ferritin heavy polypeptide-like 17 [Rattus rattus]
MAEASSQVRQNYDRCCEDAINNHIRLLLQASYSYLSMAFYFDRDDVALGNFKRFFLSKSHNCKASAEMFVFMQNKREACFSAQHHETRPLKEVGTGPPSHGMPSMEMTINQSLLNLHELAKGKDDAHLCDFLGQHCLDQQVHVLKKMGGYLTNLRQMGAPEQGLAEYLFDKLSLS